MPSLVPLRSTTPVDPVCTWCAEASDTSPLGLRFIPGTAVTVQSTQEAVCDLPSWHAQSQVIAEDRGVGPTPVQLPSLVPVVASRDPAAGAALESQWHAGLPLPTELREEWFKQLTPDVLATIRKHCHGASVPLREVCRRFRLPRTPRACVCSCLWVCGCAGIVCV